jgi:hypothetical protein
VKICAVTFWIEKISQIKSGFVPWIKLGIREGKSVEPMTLIDLELLPSL